MLTNVAPILLLAIPLVASVLIAISGKQTNLREAWTFIAALTLVGMVIYLIEPVLAGELLSSRLFTIAIGIDLYFNIDALGLLFAGLASTLWLINSIFSIAYMRGLNSKRQTLFYSSFAVCIAATLGIAFAGNLLTFFIFYEILTVATYPLVVHKMGNKALLAGRKYLIYTIAAGQLFLVGIIIVYTLAGDGDFIAGGFLDISMASKYLLWLVFGLMFMGAAVKAGMMPLHGWLPAAMVAPTPVSALLHAVAVVKAGVFATYRIVGFVFGPELFVELALNQILAWLATITILISSVVAIQQDELKKRLAYSTIGQLSYVLLGIALVTTASMTGAAFHMITHGFMKITLFFFAGAIYVITGRDRVSQLRGVGRAYPGLFIAFAVVALGIAGMPFLAGFVSKLQLISGAIVAGQMLFVLVLIASALLSLSYLMPVVYAGFFRDTETELTERVSKKYKIALILPVYITAMFSVIFGVRPDFIFKFYELANMAARSLF